MNHRKKKPDFSFTYMALGLIIGFFMGTGIVYWYSNRQSDSIFSRKLWDYFSKAFRDEELPGTFQVTEELPQKPVPARRGVTRKETSLSDTLNLAGIEKEVVNDSLLLDTLALGAAGDSLAETNDSVVITGEVNNSQDSLPEKGSTIHIAKDSLLSTRAYSLPKATPETERDLALRKLDSLLGNYPRNSRTDNMMIVEFWLSPLNFHGYKMSHNKIILFGLDQPESFSLHSDGNSIFIKYFEEYFPVSLTMDFKPLVPSNTPDLQEENREQWP